MRSVPVAAAVRRARSWIMVVVVVALAPLAVASRQLPTISGSYTSNWDGVRLEQHGTRVTGSYVCCGGGSIEGTIEGSIVRYRWSQPGAQGAGRWAVEDGRLVGTWGWGTNDHDGGRWDLTRTRQLAQ